MRKKVFASIVFLVTMLFAVVGWATDWFVRPAGGDYGNEDGTSYENAWDGFANIDWTKIQPGDTLWLDGSAVYYETLSVGKSGTSENPIVIDGSYGGGKAVIDGENTRDRCLSSWRSHLRVRNIIARNSKVTAIMFGHATAFYDVVIENCDVSSPSYNNTGAGLQMQNAHNCKIINCSVYDGYNTGLFVNVSGDGTTSDVLIRNCVVDNCKYRGIGVSGVSGDNSILTNVVVDSCKVSNCGDGIYVHWANNIEIKNCISHDNTADGEGYGIAFSRVRDSSIHDCIVYNNRYDGIEIWGESGDNADSDNCEVYRNIVYNHTNTQGWGAGDGIEVCTAYSDNCKVYYNLLYNNTVNLRIGDDSVNCVAYNNTCYGGQYSLTIEQTGSGWTVTNNIFAGASNYAIYSETTDAAINHNRNCYYKAGDVVSYNGTTYTLEQVPSFESDAINQNPLLTSNYRLSRNSPCIDAGIKLSIHDSDWRDLAGNKQRYGTAPDIGCYEYNSDLDTRWGRRHRWMFGRWGVGRWKKNRWAPYKE